MANANPQTEISVAHLGAHGDGVADTGAGPLYVPLALPGERVRVTPGAKRGAGRAAALLEVLEPSAHRVEPPCRHFGTCGGCAVQHLQTAAYLEWKRGLVVAALARHGIDGSAVEAVVATAPGGRRRAELAALRLRGRRGKTLLGFHARGSHKIVDVEDCVVLRPALQDLLPALRDALALILAPGGGCDVALTETLLGIDLLLTAKAPPTLKQSQALARFAEAADLARASWMAARGGAEPVALRRRPAVKIGEVAVALPPGAFVQASAEAEAIMTTRVLDHIGERVARGRIADLYGGLGTFSLPLAAAGAQVHAVDSADDSLDALLNAAGAGGLGGRITVETRDLAERPLMAAELARFDAVVFDPPRAGAAAVSQQIAASQVPRVAAVSCNPATFARDAATLIAGGYRLTRVTPVDQFVYTGHVELVAGFARD